MAALIFGFILLTWGMVALALQRFYSTVPSRELKRLAARGDQLAQALFRPVAYGNSMRIMLWTIAGLNLTFGVLLTVPNLPGPIAFLVVLLALAGMAFIQSMRLTVRTASVAVHAAPAVSWLLSYVHTPFDYLARSINRHRQHEAHSGLYEKEDLVALIQQQKEQVDNRISAHDLEIVERAAAFDDRHAADIVTPMAKALMVKVDDHIGPILLGELHASGQNSFLVYDGTKDHVVGTLLLREAAQAKEGGLVSALMHSRISYVHEDFGLRQVLQAFAMTGQFLVVVINSFEEPVGIITMQQLLAQLVGEREADDFDAFEDRAAVANYRPELPEPVEPEPEAAPADVEVVKPEAQS